MCDVGEGDEGEMYVDCWLVCVKSDSFGFIVSGSCLNWRRLLAASCL